MGKTMIKEKVTGRLDGWWYDEMNHVIWGHIFNDIKERFRDGSLIHTSNLRHGKDTKFYEGMIVNTLNSNYLLGKAS